MRRLPPACDIVRVNSLFLARPGDPTFIEHGWCETICGVSAEFEVLMKKLRFIFLALALAAMSALAFAADSTINGTISDSMCGAKGANASHAGCMAKCMSRGAKAVIVTDGDQKVLVIDNPDAIKGHEGHHVAITGKVTGDSIHVDSMKMM